MIFRTALKYKLAELFVETLFQKIFVNFLHGENIPKVGDHYTKIDEYYSGKRLNRYFDCKILEYNPITNEIRFSHGTTYNFIMQTSFSGNGGRLSPLDILILIK